METIVKYCGRAIQLSALGLVIFIMAVLTNASTNYGKEPVIVESARML